MNSPPESYVRAMQLLAAGFNRELTEHTLAAYWAVLSTCSEQAITRAAQTILERDEWFPVPSRYLEVARHWDKSLRAKRVVRQHLQRLEKPNAQLSGPD